MTTTNTISTRPLLVAAAIPSALSLAWTAWSIADMVPAPWPIAVAAGIALDIALVAAVALAWMAPSVTRPAQVASWVVAALAAAAIGVHSFEITPALALLAAVPLVAKGLWHLALVAKTAAEDARRKAEQEQEQKQRRLSTDLTEDEEAKVADLKRRAAFTKEQAEAQRELDAATSEAQHRAKLAQIQRQAEEQMAADEATAQIHVRRHELAQQINLAAPVAAAAPAQHQQLPAVPDDASSLTPQNPGSEAGFGGAFATATGPAAAGGASPADLGVPRGASPAAPSGAPGGASPQADPATEPVSGPGRLAAYLAARGTEATVRGAARDLGVDPRTVRRYRDRLAEAGTDTSALS